MAASIFSAPTDVEEHALHSKFEISAIPLYPERSRYAPLFLAKYFFCISIPSAWSFLSFFFSFAYGCLSSKYGTVAGLRLFYCDYKVCKHLFVIIRRSDCQWRFKSLICFAYIIRTERMTACISNLCFLLYFMPINVNLFTP